MVAPNPKTIFPLFLFFIIGFFVAYVILSPKSISDTPLPSPSPTPPVQLWQEPPFLEKSVVDGIRQAFAQKYNRNIDQIEISVNQYQLPYARGSVSFSPGSEGGWYLAYQKAGVWQVVLDGNGGISCQVVNDYLFPLSMVPECSGQENNPSNADEL